MGDKVVNLEYTVTGRGGYKEGVTGRGYKEGVTGGGLQGGVCVKNDEAAIDSSLSE